MTAPAEDARAARRTAASDASQPVVPHTTPMPRSKSMTTCSFAAWASVNSKATVTPRQDASRIVRAILRPRAARSTTAANACPRVAARASIARPILP